eukprot:2632156-Pyramimonas_sp.AAC.1
MEGEGPGGLFGSAADENERKRLQEALGTLRAAKRSKTSGTAGKQGRWWVCLAVNCNAWSRFGNLLGTAAVRCCDFVAVQETHLDSQRTQD